MLRIEVTIHGNQQFFNDFIQRKIETSENRGKFSLISRFHPIITEALKDYGFINIFLIFEDTRCINSGSNGSRIFIIIKDEGQIISESSMRDKLSRTISERIFILTSIITQCFIHPSPSNMGSYKTEELMN
jgi:hypothetical protein